MAISAPLFTFSVPTAGFSSRARLVLGLLALVWSTAAAHAGRPALRSYAAMDLKDGRQLIAVDVVSYTANGILVNHAGGATVVRTKVLPDAVIDDLRLSRLETVETPALDPAFLALADKPAVAEDPATPAAAPDIGPDAVAVPAPTPAPGSADAMATIPAAEPTAAPVAAAVTEPAAPAPAGEGNIPEFFAAQTAIAAANTSGSRDLTGRVVVSLPSGQTRLLEGVEIRAYPAALLETYLRDADVRCHDAAQKLLALADIAQREGRTLEAEHLTTRARKATAARLDYVPVAPFATRTDAFGHFTVRHNLPEARLVAVGFVTVAHEQLRYEWIGVVPENDIILTEANATTATVAATALPAPRFAAR